MKKPKVLTVSQYCKLYRVKSATVRKALREGREVKHVSGFEKQGGIYLLTIKQ